jgi:hypothetical protein
MTDEAEKSASKKPEPGATEEPTAAPATAAPASPEASAAMPPPQEAAPAGDLPNYKGAPLDPDRGPGLGCFWIQVVVLVTFLILTPLTVTWAWPSWISALMLVIVLVLLLFVGQTTIFLLRLVAADRRTARRRPMSPTARKTVGDLEEEATASGPGSEKDDA